MGHGGVAARIASCQHAIYVEFYAYAAMALRQIPCAAWARNPASPRWEVLLTAGIFKI
jgi:hypothetical protein